MSEVPVTWKTQHAPPSLAPGEIHCWLISLDETADESLLAEDERERAARFQFDEDRRRFIAGRAARRKILAAYLDAAADALVFEEEEGGRPFLKGAALNFNMSRSQGWALFAVSSSSILGADLEAIRLTDDLSHVAADNFSKTELAALAILEGEGWARGFFNCWTRKEAVVKAAGAGLLMPLNLYDVTLKPGEGAEILRAEGESSPAAAWSLSAFNPLDGYCAAIVSDLAAPDLRFLRAGF